MPPRARLAIAVGVSIVWAVSFVASLVVKDYKPDPSINAAFTLVLGAALAKWDSKNGDEDDKEKTGKHRGKAADEEEEAEA